MRRRRFAGLAPVAPLLGLVAVSVGCGVSTDLPSTSDTSSVDLGFGVLDSRSISAFDYVIEGDEIATRTGRIRLDDPQATLSTLLGGLPSGSDYRLALNAVTTDGSTFCNSVSTFDVISPLATSLQLALMCTHLGAVRTLDVYGTTYDCPALSSTTVARAGTTIKLSASAYSFDDAPVMYLWEAMDGVLGAPTEVASSYECLTPGPQLVRVSASNGFCVDSKLVDFSCP